jgi:hypothetical protein
MRRALHSMAQEVSEMVGEIVICALAAAGVLLVVWAMVAALILPARADCIVVAATGDAAELQQKLRTYSFLRNSGLMRTRIVIVDCGLSAQGLQIAQRLAQPPEIVLCDAAALPEVWKTEREL